MWNLCSADHSSPGGPWSRSGSARQTCSSAEAHVVGQDQQDVGRAFRGGDLLGKVLDGVLGLAADVPLEGLLRSRQDFLGICRWNTRPSHQDSCSDCADLSAVSVSFSCFPPFPLVCRMCKRHHLAWLLAISMVSTPVECEISTACRTRSAFPPRFWPEFGRPAREHEGREAKPEIRAALIQSLALGVTVKIELVISAALFPSSS